MRILDLATGSAYFAMEVARVNENLLRWLGRDFLSGSFPPLAGQCDLTVFSPWAQGLIDKG